jgi:UPF0716 protein FxsA
MIYFILYIFLETIITIEAGSILGGGFTFLEIIITFLLGIFLIQNFKYSFVETLMSLAKQEINPKEMMSINILSFIGAVFLIIPGIFSDILGLLLQIDFFAIFIAEKFIATKIKTKTNFNYTNSNFKNNNDIIEGEIIETQQDYIENTKEKK